MFIKQMPRFGDWKVLAASFVALTAAGCANLSTAPGSEEQPVAAVAIPLQTQQSESDIDAGQFQYFDDFSEAAAFQEIPATSPKQIPELSEPGSVVKVPMSLDIEFEAEQAELALQKQRQAEAEVVAAIEASLQEKRRKNNAWYRLQTGMQLTPVDNPRVAAQLKWYLDHPGYLQRVMERARPILPFVLDELEKRNLPTELALLPIVESAYQAFAYSHGRASGMWQIIPSTGRFLGLKQNWWYDGRRDIIESTHAAINYLDSLARQFNGDWELALAAYNAGPGKIRKAVRYNKKRKRPTDFWHLTKIRKETRSYVPKMFALQELFANPDKYQLDLVPVNNEVSYEIVELDGQIDLALAADLAGISVNQLYQLNPAFNRWATAPKGPHRLLLPRGKAEQFKIEVAKVPPGKRINWVRHKIKTGETLSQISRKYRSSVTLIKQVNKIRGTNIRAGKYLMVPTA
ncbi:MAG: transglycosylase SLT domain-containing protein, partial [Gammaproteobacteria bacterium]|nr:transglycosylase SLT domain-containing protein [Gammaproteobacteria bacterium]